MNNVQAALAQRPRYHCGDLITWEMRDGSRCVGVVEARVAAGVSTHEVVAATYSPATLANWRFRRDASGHRYIIELDTPRLGFRTIVRSTRFIDARATRLGPG